MNKQTNDYNRQQKKDFVLNYLNELYLKNKDLKASDRYLEYIEYLANNFSYDKDFLESYLKGITDYKDTQQDNEDRLYRLFTEGKGTCMQFAQALSLITTIDYCNNKEISPFLFGTCTINKKGNEMGHAINILYVNEGTYFIVDLSSMIHCIEGEYKQDSSKFSLVTIDNYEKNLKKEDVKIVSNSTNKKLRAVICYPLSENINEYYETLNKSANDINSDINKCYIFYLDELIEQK